MLDFYLFYFFLIENITVNKTTSTLHNSVNTKNDKKTDDENKELENLRPCLSRKQYLLKCSASDLSLSSYKNDKNEMNNKNEKSRLSLSSKRKRDQNDGLELQKNSTPKRRFLSEVACKFVDTPSSSQIFRDIKHTSTPKHTENVAIPVLNKKNVNNLKSFDATITSSNKNEIEKEKNKVKSIIPLFKTKDQKEEEIQQKISHSHSVKECLESYDKSSESTISKCSDSSSGYKLLVHNLLVEQQIKHINAKITQIKSENINITHVGSMYWMKKERNHQSKYDIVAAERDKTCYILAAEEIQHLHDNDRWQELLKINYSNALQFKFKCTESWKIYDDYSPLLINSNEKTIIIPDHNNEIGFTEIVRAFLAIPEVDISLISTEWIKNHYRMILLKLSDKEIRFPDVFYKTACHPHVIVETLKYRYDVEFYEKRMSCLKNILCGKKPLPFVPMVLVVLDIIKTSTSEEGGAENFELLLSDRWYSIRACIDDLMKSEIFVKKIEIGSKLLIMNAELIELSSNNSTKSNLRLKIHSNSVKVAKFEAKLGYQKCLDVSSIRLSDISVKGGNIAKIKVLIVYKYPLVYVKMNHLNNECPGN